MPSVTYQHHLPLDEAKECAEAAFNYYRDEDARAKTGLLPTIAWRAPAADGAQAVADITLMVNKKRLAGTVLITPSTNPRVKKDGTVVLNVVAPPELQLFVPSLINVVGKEVEKWLKMMD